MERIRIKDIAEQAGVSPTTVSNVIHGNTKKVSGSTIEKIEKLLSDVEYIPSMGARMLAENRSRIIGVLLGSKADKRRSGRGDSFANQIISALEYEIYKRNYYMMLHMSSTTEENIQLAATWNVEGLITVGLSVQETLRIQNRCKAPVVSIDNYYSGDRVANVGLDDWQGGYEMGRFLAKAGHERLLFLADNDIGVDHFRWLGFRKALEEAGLPREESRHVVFPQDSGARMSYYEKSRELFLSQDALFFASDYYALEAVNYLQDKGVRIPADISVAGFDDSEYAEIARPALTTIRQDVGQKGVVAVEKLFSFIEEKKNVKMDEKLPVRLIVRDSVAVRQNSSHN